MPAKKEAAHDCKAECAELHRQLASLKREVAALKVELKKAPKGGGSDPRVDKILSALRELPSFRTICANRNIKV